MTVITELGSAGIVTSTFMVPDWSLPDWSTDAMSAVAFDVPDVAVNVHSSASHSPVVLEKPAVYSQRVVEALLPPSMTDQQNLTRLYHDVTSPDRISRVAFEAVWRKDSPPATTSVDRTCSDLLPTQNDVILSAVSQLSPITPADLDEAWNWGIVRRSHERLARETDSAVADIQAMKPGSDLAKKIAADPHLRKVYEKAKRHDHERYLPEREAHEAVTAARDAMMDHVAYMQGKPAPGVKLEGYSQWLDVKLEHDPKPFHSVPGGKDSGVVFVGPDDKPIYEGRRPHSIKLHKQKHTPGQAQDLATIAEEARYIADTAQNRKIKAGRVYGRVKTPQKVVLFTTLAAVLASCGSGGVVPPDAPTLPPPGGGVQPTLPQLTPEALPTIYASATPPVDAVAQFQVAPPDVLPEPGKLQVVAGLSSVFPGLGEVFSTTPLDDRITKALNAQGVQPFFGYDNKGNPIFSADVAVRGGKAVCLPAVPEKIADRDDPQHVFSYVPNGAASPVVGFGKPDLLGKAGGSDNVIRYGVTANGQTDIAGILSPVLPSVDNTSCAYGSVTNADITPNPNDFVGAMVAVHFDNDGKIVAYESPVLVDPSKVAINVQSSGEALLNGQPMESRIWVSTATAIPMPSGTATLSATIPPPATETPAPTAPPAETQPTSCLDKESVQGVVNSYLELKKKADLIEALQAHVDKYGGVSTGYGRDKTNTYSIGMGYDNVPILGEFEIKLENGTGYCTVFAVPVTNAQKKVVSVNVFAMFTDATIGGTYSGSFMPYYTEDPGVARQFIADHVNDGVPVKVSFILVGDLSSKPRVDTFTVDANVFNYKNRSVLGDIVRNSYVWRFAGDLKTLQEVAGSVTAPDPMKIVESLDPAQEVGLLSSAILEIK